MHGARGGAVAAALRCAGGLLPALCAYGGSPWQPLAVRVADEVVGFVMWGIDPEDESFWIGGLIVDRQHERRGYGRAVVAQLLERAASDGYRDAALGYDHENKLAQSLCASVGFVETRTRG
jgi:diamine N-acetyltransferase